jgi:hypothetical protein
VAALGALVASVPLFFWRRLLFAMRFAPLGRAVVQSVELHRPTKDTVDATINGMARGTWLVRAGDREFSAVFEDDSPWASELKPGAAVLVLVHPTKSKALFAVGIAHAV